MILPSMKSKLPEWLTPGLLLGNGNHRGDECAHINLLKNAPYLRSIRLICNHLVYGIGCIVHKLCLSYLSIFSLDWNRDPHIRTQPASGDIE